MLLRFRFFTHSQLILTTIFFACGTSVLAQEHRFERVPFYGDPLVSDPPFLWGGGNKKDLSATAELSSRGHLKVTLYDKEQSWCIYESDVTESQSGKFAAVEVKNIENGLSRLELNIQGIEVHIRVSFYQNKKLYNLHFLSRGYKI